MQPSRVLAVCSDANLLARIEAGLAAAGVNATTVANLSSIATPLAPHRYVFVANTGAVEQLTVQCSKLRDNAHVCVIAPRASLSELTQYMRDPRINHVIVGDEIESNIATIATKFNTGDIFGIEKYLPQGTPVHYVRLRDFAGRSAAIDTVLEFAEANKMRRQVRSAIGQVCEELLMNALYDAPVDERGNQIFAEIDPHERTGVPSPRPVSIRYAATEDRFVIAVRDRFGRLAKNTILAYIEKCLHSPTQIDRKTYGAGLGLYLVANAAASYVVNVAYGVATEVVCSFDRGAKTPLRLVGMFVHPGNAEMLAGRSQTHPERGEPSLESSRGASQGVGPAGEGG